MTRRGWAKKIVVAVAMAAAAVLILFLVSTFIHLEVPDPTGPFAVGKMQLTWVDTSRSEWMAASPTDHREVIATARTYALAFFDRYLRGASEPAFEDIRAATKTRVDMYVAGEWQM